MSNILDYICWRGDLSFTESPFNEIDGAILSRASYIPFELIFSDFNWQTITIEAACRQLLAKECLPDAVLIEDDLLLIEALMNSPRFQKLDIIDYASETDVSSQVQFSAVSFLILPKLCYIAYRGTDNTLVGWKEDFNMSYLFPVPAQTKALEYLNKISGKGCYNFLMGGHSKGGNIAIYAASCANDTIQNSIVGIYSYDSPGFAPEYMQRLSVNNILPRLHSFVPQSSVVGMLFEHVGTPSIIYSDKNNGFLQHNIYTWQLMGTHFIYSDALTDNSIMIDRTLKDWVAGMSENQSENFFNALYELISRTNAITTNEFSEHWLDNALIILNSMKNMDDSTRHMLSETLKQLLQSARLNVKNAKKHGI